MRMLMTKVLRSSKLKIIHREAKALKFSTRHHFELPQRQVLCAKKSRKSVSSLTCKIKHLWAERQSQIAED